MIERCRKLHLLMLYILAFDLNSVVLILMAEKRRLESMSPSWCCREFAFKQRKWLRGRQRRD